MRRVLLFAAVLLAAIQLSAGPVDLRAAQHKAQAFVQQKNYGGRLNAPLRGELRLAHAEMNSKMFDRAVYYIFNSDNGYVIVSGDDRAEEILGYGDAPLDFNTIPCNMRAWLDTYKEQIEYLQAHPDLKVDRSSFNAPSRIPSVEPLLTALWDQEAPYWNMCKINNQQCLTGCPATSAAMVMHYWKYPDFETDQVPAYKCHLYTGYYSSTYVNVEALPPVTFDWDNMLDRYSGGYNSAQANAVATLMRYVGQAERMEYGTSAAGGSGISTDSVSLIVDMYKFFGYDEETVRLVRKTGSNASNEVWGGLIQEELSEGRPIVFCAVSGGFFGGGHAFNVDGYDATSKKYHINFGWSGTSNDYYALNAFDGYNQDQQMVIGIQPPMKVPRLKADATSLSMECFKNQTSTVAFTLKGSNLEGDVTLTLNDDNDVFSISETAVTPDEAGKVDKTITVTYAPKAEGTYAATITCSAPGVNDIVISLVGTSAYELYRPVMEPLDEQSVTATSFRAEWTDNTPAENVVSYTLEVKEKPDVCLLAEGDWSDVPSESVNHASDATNYLPEGWTFTGTNFYLDGGFISASRNSVIQPGCDLTGYSMVSVILRAKNYMNGGATTLTIETDEASKTIVLAKEIDTYLVVLPVGDRGYVKLVTGNYPEIQTVKVFGGEVTDPEPFMLRGASETGDELFRLIEGITPDKFYTVNGLKPATPYLYRVKAVYVNGTESLWSNTREVLLAEGGDVVLGDIDGDGNVSIVDVTELIKALLSDGADALDIRVADCTGDGVVSISDVTELINYLLSGKW